MVLVGRVTKHSRLTNNFDNHKIFQSDMDANPYINRETMQFRDNVPGHIDSRGASFDQTRDDGMLQDATLGAWFSRPVKIAEYQWATSSPIFERFNPWKLFWENPRNLEKIRNFHLLRSTLHLKILINGNAFYYGRAIAAYEPLAPIDDTSPDREWSPSDRIRGSQRMHVYLNPTTSQGGSLELPFFWPKNNWVVAQGDWNNMGEVVIASFNNLQHANGGVDPINISVMAWAENVKFAIPTRSTYQPTVSMPESGKASKGSDEHEQNVISRPATNVARIAGTLSDVPVIGPYAKATQIGANAIAETAKIFGLSAPNELNYAIFEPRAKHSIAVTDTKQSANKVTVDSKQELTIDPRTTGIRPDDELPIASIAGRESYLTQFVWTLDDESGFLLWNSRVDPGLKGRDGSEWHFPACAVAALPFQYWRGTLRFRFQVVASEYHKGRLRIAYDPRIGGLSSEYNTHYTTIHDIAESKDFTVDIGWGQDVPYRESLGWYSGNEYGLVPLTTNIRQGNGVLSVHVLNKLSVPSASRSSVQINVFISALDDFEVAAPDDKISYLKFRPSVPVPEPDAQGGYSNFMNKLRQKGMSVPESGTVPEDVDAADVPVVDPPPIDTMADSNLDVPNTTKVFMGEVIGSFRTMLRRAYRSEIRLVAEADSTAAYKISRSSFPTYGGFVTHETIPNGSMVTSFADGRFYNASLTTMLNYLGRSFLGWRGSTRWTIDTSTVNLSSYDGNGDSDLWNSITYTLARRNSYFNGQAFVDTSGPLVSNIPQLFNGIDRGMDCNGAYLGNTAVNPIQTIEVPYLQNDRFKYTFLDDKYEDEVEGPGWECSLMIPRSLTAKDTSYLKFYVSAGEDFNFFFFNGMPPVYFEQAYAQDQAG
jgi:hypothetical protein